MDCTREAWLLLVLWTPVNQTLNIGMDWPSNQGQFHLSKILILSANISTDRPLSHSCTVRHAEYEAKTYEDSCIHSWCATFVIMSRCFLTWWSVCITRCYSNQRHPVFGSALSPITATPTVHLSVRAELCTSHHTYTAGYCHQITSCLHELKFSSDTWLYSWLLSADYSIWSLLAIEENWSP